MERPTFEAHFYDTYHIANAVHNVLSDQFAYLRNLHEFYGDGAIHNYVRPFEKNSAFHAFIFRIAEDLILDATTEVSLERRQQLAKDFARIPPALRDMRPSRLPISEALAHHHIKHPSFDQFLRKHGRRFAGANDHDVEAYLDELRELGALEELLEHSVRDVFFILFQNRHLLLAFNEMMASELKECEGGDPDYNTEQYFARNGVLRRVTIPAWVQRAVFYRDRGCCVLCHCDLTGLVSVWNEENFDHMVPLDSGGLNDVTNIQLLCRRCNRKKGAGKAATTGVYEAWYPGEKAGR